MSLAGKEQPLIEVRFRANQALVGTYAMDRRLELLIDEYVGAVHRLATFGFDSRDELEQIFKAEVGSGKISKSGCILHYVAGAAEAGTRSGR